MNKLELSKPLTAEIIDSKLNLDKSFSPNTSFKYERVTSRKGSFTLKLNPIEIGDLHGENSITNLEV